jgi:heterodisulfide reductase subunit B2
MIEISYMPGCTLKTTGRNYETATLRLLESLGVRAVEVKDWVCCGTTFSLASDNLMLQLAPVRTLLRAKESGRPDLLVLCSMCYNTLRRAQELLRADPEKRLKINEFMYDEQTKLDGDEVRVIHLLNQLAERVGFEELGKRAAKKASGLKVAPYYGCMLLRPKEIAVDAEPEDPTIMERLFEACGAECVYFPFKTECCGAYQTVNEKSVILSRTRTIVTSAAKNSADVIVTSCPLCAYNLDEYQRRLSAEGKGFRPVPVMYLGQALALLLGLEDPSDYSLHAVDPRPMLKERRLSV